MSPSHILLALPLLLGSCALPDLGITARAALLQIEPVGHLALDNAAGSNVLDDIRIDLDSGFDTPEAGTLYLEARRKFNKWDVGLSGFYYSKSSSSTITRDFGDITASPASPRPIDSHLRVLNVKATVAYPVLETKLMDMGVDVSVGLALDYFDVEMDVIATGGPPPLGREDLSFTSPAPLLYARAEADLSIVSAVLELAWLDLDLGDAEGSYFDLNAMIAVTPIDQVEFFIGYRNILIDVDGQIEDSGVDHDFGTHLRMSGWFIGAGVTF